jgi:DNA-binding NtrC family response regulator
MTNFTILIVDDDPVTVESLCRLFESRSFSVRTAEDGNKGLVEIKNNRFDLILLDISLPGINGIDVLREARENNTDAAVIMMTAYASIDSAVSALRLGATDYIIKPFEPDQIMWEVDRLIERKALIEANWEFSREAKKHYDFSNIVTKNSHFLQILESVKRVARTTIPILIMGESGTGKEMVARAVHTNSDRSHRPLIAVNCGAIPPSLIESEFFGHVKGAFTGAVSDHKGFFERADRSTLFLDEIGELPMDLQVKLLRVLQEGQINRVGDSCTIDLDFRLIVATQRNLDEEVRTGRFRQDLYYRLNVFPIKLPPLRERSEDIPALVGHFLKLSPRPGMRMSDEAMEILMKYPWPGNVRELENVVERASILADGNMIKPQDLPLDIKDENPEFLVKIPPGILNYKEVMENVTDLASHELIVRALNYYNNHITRTAQALGISRRLLTYRIKELGLRRNEEAEE